MSPEIRSDRGPRRLQGDEGSILIEALVVIPVLMTLLAGVMDFGVGWRDRQLVQASGRNGARVAAASNNYGALATADRDALTTVWAGLQTMKNIEVRRVVIFNANPTTWADQSSDALKAPPAACLPATLPPDAGSGINGTGGVYCNIYSANQLKNAATTWPAGCTSSAYDRFWCPTTRKNQLGDNANKGPDYLGLYVEIRYTTFTGYLVKTVDITDTTIVRLEPRS